MKVYKLFYSNDIKERTRISGQNFVEKNKYKYKIIYKNKIYPLQGIFKIIENKIEKFKIKLICYNHHPDIDKISYFLTKYKYYEIEKLKRNIYMFRFIDYLFHSSYEIIRLIYNIGKEDKIQIFGEEYVGINGNKCSILYRNKIIPLQSHFLIKEINKEDKANKKFEILLFELEVITERSYMFANCKLLDKFGDFEIVKSKGKDNLIEEEKNLDSENINKYYNIYSNNASDYFNEEIIKVFRDYISKDTINYFILEFNKIDKVKINSWICLKSLSHMFYECSSLKSLPDISGWNTNDVNDMSSMFEGCSSLIFFPDISKWNTDIN